jgi:hypothetical protein
MGIGEEIVLAIFIGLPICAFLLNRGRENELEREGDAAHFT